MRTHSICRARAAWAGLRPPRWVRVLLNAAIGVSASASSGSVLAAVLPCAASASLRAFATMSSASRSVARLSISGLNPRNERRPGVNPSNRMLSSSEMTLWTSAQTHV